MSIYHGKSKKKSTGGRYIISCGKKKCHYSNNIIFTKVGEEKKKKCKCMGGLEKVKLIFSNYVNVFNKKDRKTKKVKIIKVMKNNSNKNYTQRNIINKGTVVKTEIGEAVITSRTGQDSVLNAILIE